MMDHDIVDQLRSKYQGQLPICTQAADEIERLRTELAYWRRVAETEHIRFTNELKAVSGE